jgi:hypothetical protein
MNLFEIRAALDGLRGQIESLLDESSLDDSGEVESEAIASLLEALDQTFAEATDKAEAYARVINRMESESEQWAADAAACMARSRQARRRAEELKKNLGAFVLSEGGKLRTPTLTLSARQENRYRVEVLDDQQLPPRFAKTSPNETALKAALIEGDEEAAQYTRLLTETTIRLTRRSAGKGNDTN